MKKMLTSLELEDIVTGNWACPELSENLTVSQKKEYFEWQREDAKAAGLIVAALSEPIAGLLINCRHAKDIWEQLCTRFERSSSIRLNTLFESFFRSTRNHEEDMNTHIAKLQKLFDDLNKELKIQSENELSERILIGKILSTLEENYNYFKDDWNTIPLKDQTLGLLTEKLCATEMRFGEPLYQSSGLSAGKSIAQKSPSRFKRSASHNLTGCPKWKFSCDYCRQKGHSVSDCPQKKYSYTPGYSEKAKNEHYGFVSQPFRAFQTARRSNNWYGCYDASYHTARRTEFMTNNIQLATPRLGLLTKLGGSGTRFVHPNTNQWEKWHGSHMTAVGYFPGTSANLYPVKTAGNNKLAVAGRRNNNALVATGRIQNNPLVTNFRTPTKEISSIILAGNRNILRTYLGRMDQQGMSHFKEFLKKLAIRVAGREESVHDGSIVGRIQPFRSRPNRATKVGEIVHAELYGPTQIESIEGARYFACFKDDYSRFRMIFFLKNKGEICETLESLLREAKKNGHTVNSLRCVGGKEFDKESIREFLSEFGVVLVIDPPDSQRQNRSADREDRNVLEAARFMLYSTSLPKTLWAEACNTAVYLLNLTGKSLETNKTPYEIWHNKKVTNPNHLKIFGTRCYANVADEKGSNFDNKAVAGHMVGYVNETDGYRVWIPNLGTVICTREVKFKNEIPWTKHPEPSERHSQPI